MIFVIRKHPNTIGSVSRLSLCSGDLPPQFNSSNEIDEYEFLQIKELAILSLISKTIALATNLYRHLRQVFHHSFLFMKCLII